MLQKEAGPRIDPPVQEPIEPNTMLAATEAAEPLEEPPGVCSRFQGLRTSPYRPLWLPQANSRQWFFPDQHSAGSVQIAHGSAVVVRNVVGEYAGAVGSAYASRGIDVLDRVRYAVQRPAVLPLRYLLAPLVARFASALSPSTVRNAFNLGLSASMRLSTACVSSTGESLRASIALAASAKVRLVRSADIWLLPVFELLRVRAYSI